MSLYESQEVRVEKNEELNNDFHIIRLKHKLTSSPGRFVMVGIPGFGESPFYIASENEEYVELLIKKTGNNTNELCKTKPKDKIFIRGPYGRGFSINNLKNKNIYIITKDTGFSASRGLIHHMLQKREDYKNVNIYCVFKNESEEILTKELDKWNQKFHVQKYYSQDKETKTNYDSVVDRIKKEIIPHDSVVLICTDKALLTNILDALKDKGLSKKNIYFTYEQNMQCGVAKCGTCLIHGKKVCRDGPVFRFDELEIKKKGADE